MTSATKLSVIGVFGLMAIIGCATAQTTVDPCAEPGVTEAFLPHPTDCTKYFSCYGGKGYEQTCPDGKFFDPMNKWCDIPEKANCVVNNCPPDGIVYLPIPDVCDRFTICIGGVAFEGVCDDNLYFDAELQECNLKNETDCVVNPCIQPPPDPPVELEIYPNPANCQQYLLCLQGEPIIRNCAPNLFFDPTLLHCVEAEDCIEETATVMNELEVDVW
ncbi:peritrophin-1-like [Anopheles funestus]|uniref:peritrophin-1-like n=1 Tax=Anopheles funestus TaxID=62324 RepID=UPI0020C63D7E|nr:peritrophin-1-like [Anopheles funestus]